MRQGSGDSLQDTWSSDKGPASSSVRREHVGSKRFLQETQGQRLPGEGLFIPATRLELDAMRARSRILKRKRLEEMPSSKTWVLVKNC